MLPRVAAALAGLPLILSATSVFAAEPVLAKLQTGLPSAQKPVAGGSVFECLGAMCAARAQGSDANGVRGCKELARQVGVITSYGPSSHPLAADQLANCNESARK